MRERSLSLISAVLLRELLQGRTCRRGLGGHWYGISRMERRRGGGLGFWVEMMMRMPLKGERMVEWESHRGGKWIRVPRLFA